MSEDDESSASLSCEGEPVAIRFEGLPHNSSVLDVASPSEVTIYNGTQRIKLKLFLNNVDNETVYIEENNTDGCLNEEQENEHERDDEDREKDVQAIVDVNAQEEVVVETVDEPIAETSRRPRFAYKYADVEESYLCKLSSGSFTEISNKILGHSKQKADRDHGSNTSSDKIPPSMFETEDKAQSIVKSLYGNFGGPKSKRKEVKRHGKFRSDAVIDGGQSSSNTRDKNLNCVASSNNKNYGGPKSKRKVLRKHKKFRSEAVINSLQTDTKLWSRTYVRLVDCSRFLNLKMLKPHTSAITTSVADAKPHTSAITTSVADAKPHTSAINTSVANADSCEPKKNKMRIVSETVQILNNILVPKAHHHRSKKENGSGDNVQTKEKMQSASNVKHNGKINTSTSENKLKHHEHVKRKLEVSSPNNNVLPFTELDHSLTFSDPDKSNANGPRHKPVHMHRSVSLDSKSQGHLWKESSFLADLICSNATTKSSQKKKQIINLKNNEQLNDNRATSLTDSSEKPIVDKLRLILSKQNGIHIQKATSSNLNIDEMENKSKPDNTEVKKKKSHRSRSISSSKIETCSEANFVSNCSSSSKIKILDLVELERKQNSALRLEIDDHRRKSTSSMKKSPSKSTTFMPSPNCQSQSTSPSKIDADSSDKLKHAHRSRRLSSSKSSGSESKSEVSRVRRHSNSFHSSSSEPRSELSLVEPRTSNLRGDVKSMQPFVKLVRLPLKAIESFLKSAAKSRETSTRIDLSSTNEARSTSKPQMIDVFGAALNSQPDQQNGKLVSNLIKHKDSKHHGSSKKSSKTDNTKPKTEVSSTDHKSKHNSKSNELKRKSSSDQKPGDVLKKPKEGKPETSKVQPKSRIDFVIPKVQSQSKTTEVKQPPIVKQIPKKLPLKLSQAESDRIKLSVLERIEKSIDDGFYKWDANPKKNKVTDSSLSAQKMTRMPIPPRPLDNMTVTRPSRMPDCSFRSQFGSNNSPPVPGRRPPLLPTPRIIPLSSVHQLPTPPCQTSLPQHYNNQMTSCHSRFPYEAAKAPAPLLHTPRPPAPTPLLGIPNLNTPIGGPKKTASDTWVRADNTRDPLGLEAPGFVDEDYAEFSSVANDDSSDDDTSPPEAIDGVINKVESPQLTGEISSLDLRIRQLAGTDSNVIRNKERDSNLGMTDQENNILSKFHGVYHSFKLLQEQMESVEKLERTGKVVCDKMNMQDEQVLSFTEVKPVNGLTKNSLKLLDFESQTGQLPSPRTCQTSLTQSGQIPSTLTCQIPFTQTSQFLTPETVSNSDENNTQEISNLQNVLSTFNFMTNLLGATKPLNFADYKNWSMSEALECLTDDNLTQQLFSQISSVDCIAFLSKFIVEFQNRNSGILNFKANNSIDDELAPRSEVPNWNVPVPNWSATVPNWSASIQNACDSETQNSFVNFDFKRHAYEENSDSSLLQLSTLKKTMPSSLSLESKASACLETDVMESPVQDQEALASKISDEIELLEVLISIQRNLAGVDQPDSSEDGECGDSTKNSPQYDDLSNRSDLNNSQTGMDFATSSIHQADGDNSGETKKALEDRLIATARSALRPHYLNQTISSQEFKFIMKKIISKINKATLSEKRVIKFINAYVQKIVRSRTKTN